MEEARKTLSSPQLPTLHHTRQTTVTGRDEYHNDDCDDPLCIAEGGHGKWAYRAKVNATNDGKYQLITPAKKKIATFFAVTFIISVAAAAQCQQEYHDNFGLAVENNCVDDAWQTLRG